MIFLKSFLIRGTFPRFPIIRIIVYWGLSWGQYVPTYYTPDDWHPHFPDEWHSHFFNFRSGSSLSSQGDIGSNGERTWDKLGAGFHRSNKM